MRIIYCFLIILLFGCSDFLEEYSQDQAYIQSYEDLDELLLGNAYFQRNSAQEWQSVGLSGSAYFPWVHVMADELTQVTDGDMWMPSGACNALFGYFTWQFRVYEDMEGKEVWDDASDFRNLYSHINACNMILEELKAFENLTDEEDVQNVNRIKGECYFLRGSCYFLLVNFYGKPYSKLSAEEDPAVPIKLSNYIEDKLYTRNTVAEVYEQILKDLLAAEQYLQNVPRKSLWRADVNAARLMLSRVYLYMCKYEEAVKYAKLVTDNGPQVEDLNFFSGEDFLNANLSELIFSMGASSLPGNITLYDSYVYGNLMRVSDELYELYNPGNPVDLRLKYFVVDYNGALRYRKLQGATYTTTDVSDVFVCRTSEAWLNLAEAAACSGDETTAKDALNYLRARRIQQDLFDKNEVKTLEGEELVRFIRDERARELCLEGHRWFDLRRYRVALKYPQAITLERTVMSKIYNSSTWVYEPVWTRKYILPSDDPAWVMALPKSELDKNTGIIDNPRNERAYENLNN